MNYAMAKNCIRNNNKEMFRVLYEQSKDNIAWKVAIYIVKGKYLKQGSHKLNLEDQISFLDIVCTKLNASDKSFIVREVIDNAIEVEDFEIFKHFVQKEKVVVSERSLQQITKKNLQQWFDICFKPKVNTKE